MQPRTDTIDKQAEIKSGRKIKMTFDQSALPHLQNIFIDMYADPVAATIREILSNARDATLRSGSTEPVEVELPSEWRSEFVVRDRGTGMSPTVFEENYSKYGASTKREDDLETGMLGLGAKAPLSYTDQFTVVTVGGGVRTVAIVSRGDTGTGEIDVISETETDEQSGTEVRIPVRDTEEFNRAVHRHLRFWKPEWVTIDGEHPEEIEGFRIDPDILLTGELNEDVIVMGGVPYKVNYQHRLGSWNTNAVVTVPMGTVDFAPSREEVRYTERTKATLDTAREFIRDAVTRRVQDEVAAQPSASDAIHHLHTEVYPNTDTRLIKGDIFYGGTKIPTSWTERVQSYDVRADERTIEHTVTYAHFMNDNAVLVDDYPNRTLSRRNKDKARKLLDQRGLSPRYVAFIDASGRFGQPWTDHVTRVSWEDIKAVEIPRAESRGSSSHVSAGTYKVAESVAGYWKTHEVEAEELIGRPMVYMSPSNDFENYTRLAKHFGDDITLVILGRNRWDKFEREYADTTHVHEALKFEMELVVAEMDGSEAQWDNLGWNDRWINQFSAEHADRITDADLSEAVRSYSEAQGKISRYNAALRFFRQTGGGYYDAPDMPTSDGKVDLRDLKSRYPLLDDSRNTDALIEYVNAMVALAAQAQREAEEEVALSVA